MGDTKETQENKRMDSLRIGDEQAAAVQKTPNRVSLDHIESSIGAEYTFTLGAAIEALDMPALDGLAVMAVHVIVMSNGFIVIGKSSPADPANFDADLVRKFAREDAIRQIWPLEAYALKQRILEYKAPE